MNYKVVVYQNIQSFNACTKKESAIYTDLDNIMALGREMVERYLHNYGTIIRVINADTGATIAERTHL